jgi:hypothetical protein
MQSDAEIIKSKLTSIQKEYEQKLKSINELQQKIKVYNADENIRISEHAILRYIERVNNVDLKNIQKEILDDDVIRCSKMMGGTCTIHKEKYSVVIKDCVVVTITSK